MTERQDTVTDMVAQALAAPPAPHLGIGKRYRISSETPLMPRFDVRNVHKIVEMIAQIKRMPPGSEFVVDRKKLKRGTPWYYVEAFWPNGVSAGKGWVNSIALIDQEVKECTDGPVA